MIEYFKAVRARRREDEGASAVEYGLLVAAIAAAIVLVAFILGKWVFNVFDNTCETIASNGTAGTNATTCTAPAP